MLITPKKYIVALFFLFSFWLPSLATAAFFNATVFSIVDQDLDGWLAPGGPVAQGGGALGGALDCDDSDMNNSPGSPDSTVDGVDNNCDGTADNIGSAYLAYPQITFAPLVTSVGSDLLLDASASTSANGSITKYHWFLDDSGEALLSTTSAMDQINWASLDALGYGTGVYNIGLIVVDQSYGMAYRFGTLTVNATVVPVPAAVWLFGSGLLGLVGFARRYR